MRACERSNDAQSAVCLTKIEVTFPHGNTAAHLGSAHSPPLRLPVTTVPMQFWRKQNRRLWSGCACGSAVGEQQSDYAHVSGAHLVAGRKGALKPSSSFYSSVFISFYRRFGALPTRFFFLEQIKGTEERQHDEKAVLCRPCLQPPLYFGAGRVSSLSPPSLSVTMVLMQPFMQQHWRLGSGGACSSAAGEQRSDHTQVSVLLVVVGRKGASFLFYCRFGASSGIPFFLGRIERSPAL